MPKAAAPLSRPAGGRTRTRARTVACLQRTDPPVQPPRPACRPPHPPRCCCRPPPAGPSTALHSVSARRPPGRLLATGPAAVPTRATAPPQALCKHDTSPVQARCRAKSRLRASLPIASGPKAKLASSLSPSRPRSSGRRASAASRCSRSASSSSSLSASSSSEACMEQNRYSKVLRWRAAELCMGRLEAGCSARGRGWSRAAPPAASLSAQFSRPISWAPSGAACKGSPGGLKQSEKKLTSRSMLSAS